MIQVEIQFRDSREKKIHVCPDSMEKVLKDALCDPQRSLFLVVGDSDLHTHFYATDNVKAVHIKGSDAQ